MRTFENIKTVRISAKKIHDTFILVILNGQLYFAVAYNIDQKNHLFLDYLVNYFLPEVL